MFRIHRKYVIRHAILTHLKSRVDKKPGDEKDLNLSHTSLHDLALKLKLPFQEVYDYHHAMHQQHHITCTLMGGKHYIAMEESGYAAAVDQFWLREGHRELNEKIYDKARWIVPLAMLLFVAATFIFTVFTIQRMSVQINTIKTEVEKLKLQQAPTSSKK